MIRYKSEGERINDMLSNARTLTGLTAVSPGSKLRALLQLINKEIGVAVDEASNMVKNSYLQFARGTNLDYIGDIFGVSRKAPQKAFAFAEARNVKIYVEGITFGDANSGNDIVIPVGTALRPANYLTLQDPPVFYTTSDTTLLAGDTYKYITVVAGGTGENYNMGEGTLRVLDFSSYTGYSSGLLKVSNEAAIVNGAGEQTDADFIARIQGAATGGQTANATAIRLAALSVSGVDDVYIQSFSHGIGTFTLYVESIAQLTDAFTLLRVQQAVLPVVGEGIYAKIDAMRSLGVEMGVTVWTRTALSPSENTALQNNIRTTVYNYFNSFGRGYDLNLDAVRRLILSIDPNVKVLGTQQDNMLDYFYIWREGVESRIRDELINESLAVEEYEVIVPEPTLREPISVTVRYA